MLPEDDKAVKPAVVFLVLFVARLDRYFTMFFGNPSLFQQHRQECP